MRYSMAMLTAATVAQAAQSDTPWPAPVKDWVEPEPGEHPRLFFRKSDIPALRGEGGGRAEAVKLLSEFGPAAKSAIPVLRNVYRESGMQEIARAAMTAIDPNARITTTEVDIDLDLDDL